MPYIGNLVILCRIVQPCGASIRLNPLADKHISDKEDSPGILTLKSYDIHSK